MKGASGRTEWARHWPLPVISMLGVTVTGAYSYASGVFMEPIIREFGWTRAQFSSAFMLQMAVGVLFMPIMGRLVDRFGSRRMAVVGIIPFAIIFSLFATANGKLWNWWLLSLLLPLVTGLVAPTVWISGVLRGFTSSRGLAIAVVLAGMGIGAALWPPLAALYIETLGWRLAFPAIALTWAVIVLPLTLFFFLPPPIAGEPATEIADKLPPVGPMLRTPLFLGLLFAGGTFAAIQLGLIVHFVPILRGRGMDFTLAASLASIIGIFSVIGRLVSGFLLDVLPTRLVAIGAFALILPVLALLQWSDGSAPAMIVTAAVLGLAAGSEMDALTYIVSRRFPPRMFGSVYSILQSGIGLCSSLGPMAAGRLFDVSGSYRSFLLLCMPLAAATVLVIGFALSMPLHREDGAPSRRTRRHRKVQPADP